MSYFKTIEDTLLGQCIETRLMGRALLSSPHLNKSSAFTWEERELFHLIGLLPPTIETLEQQTERLYRQYQTSPTPLAKNIFLNYLYNENETAFYKLIRQHLEEMLPIIYTPTVAEAVKNFSLGYRKTRGLYLSYPERGQLAALMDHLSPDLDVIVVTDGESVLGIGDQGIGGMMIAQAKLIVYTLCAGIHPHRVLPVHLDVGTNNIQHLNDPFYLGWRHERISGQAYDDFVDQFVQGIKRRCPRAFLHWEDFGRSNAQRLLERYQRELCTFNGDMQGTGVVALASVLSGIAASGLPLDQHRIVILGAGTAGIGIADQILQALCRNGLSEEEARSHFWLLDRCGLLTEDMTLPSFQAVYARSKKETQHWAVDNASCIDLLDIVKYVRPTILIGCSTATNAFSETIVKTMASYTERPIIMPLSNPTALAEADPENLLKWTDGKAIIATGSPFPDILFRGKTYSIAQSNNALAFPGIGLGAIAARAKHLSQDMLWAATCALSNTSPSQQDPEASLLPRLSQSLEVSKQIALAVAEQARQEGSAQVPDDLEFKAAIEKMMWEPKYYPYRIKS